MPKSARVLAALSLAALVLLPAGAPSAQAPEEPKNLKVLPKNMPRREVLGLMRSFSDALGVRCIECHVSTKPGSERPEDMDYASDEKPDKETARRMIKLVHSINDQIGQMGFKDAAQVRCVTCHHGVKRPETLSALLTRTIGKDGTTAGIERYRKLRERYYGTGAYDFSAPTLVGVAGELAESKKDFDGATKLLQLNLEYYPKDADTHVALGRVQLAQGSKAAAIASFEKALELDPENRWAKQQLERAKGGQ
jgi:tetratricopeptide (TPR) repeat protein